MASDPKQGGDIFDMASQPNQVQIPGDAGKMNTIPSKPRPDQIASDVDPNSLGASTLDSAATNPGDIPRSTRDTATQEVITGTGDTLPSSVDGKRLHNVPGGVIHDPLSKGHERSEKHSVQKGSDQELGVSGSHAVEKAAGMEDMDDESANASVERKIV